MYMWATTALHCLTHPDHQRIHRPLSPQAGLTKVAAAKATLAAINPDVELVCQQSISHPIACGLVDRRPPARLGHHRHHHYH